MVTTYSQVYVHGLIKDMVHLVCRDNRTTLSVTWDKLKQ